MMDTPYRTIMHPLSNRSRVKPIVTNFETRPNIEEMEIPVWVSHVEVISPMPLEYKLQYHEEADFPLPNLFRTYYFPLKKKQENLFSLPYLLEAASSQEIKEQYFALALKAVAYNYYLAGGPSQDEATPEDMHFIMTPDERLFSFTANCALLHQAFHPVTGDKNPNKKWDKINLKLYGMGLLDAYKLS